MTVMERHPRLTSTALELMGDFAHWEKTKDIVDQFIDIMLNYRQSGHPGGSRSKVHMLLTLLLSGAMRWDPRRPEKRFALSSDHDDQWRTGGTLDEVIEEAQRTTSWILTGLQRFATDRHDRLRRLQEQLDNQ